VLPFHEERRLFMIVASVWYLCVCASRYKLNYINAFFTITCFFG
jgi:hypothetical protein